MPLTGYYLIFFGIMLTGAITTVMIGNSKKNKEGNPSYDNRTKSIFARLSIYYVIAIAVGYLALVLYVVK